MHTSQKERWRYDSKFFTFTFTSQSKGARILPICYWMQYHVLFHNLQTTMRCIVVCESGGWRKRWLLQFRSIDAKVIRWEVQLSWCIFLNHHPPPRWCEVLNPWVYTYTNWLWLPASFFSWCKAFPEKFITKSTLTKNSLLCGLLLRLFSVSIWSFPPLDPWNCVWRIYFQAFKHQAHFCSNFDLSKFALPTRTSLQPLVTSHDSCDTSHINDASYAAEWWLTLWPPHQFVEPVCMTSVLIVIQSTYQREGWRYLPYVTYLTV